jgi:hypothetical protein
VSRFYKNENHFHFAIEGPTMSVTFPGYPQVVYPSLNQPPSTWQALPSRANLPTPSPLTSDAMIQHSSSIAEADSPAVSSPSPNPSPDVTKRLTALLKAVALIVPALALTKIKPSAKVMENAAKEMLPSDWKVWTKIGLGIASISQANKALNWSPPPWLGAFMNVSVMAGLMTGFTRNSAKTIALLGPWMAALVQGTHYANQKLEKPLEEKYNIPPVATRLTLSVLSMGAGFAGLPRLMALAEPEVATAGAANTRALATGGCACCGGSPICFTELANNTTLAITQIQKHITPTQQPSQKESK